MNKLFFVIGMRRSGTSIMRTLLEKHPEINSVEFEPHPLWNAIDLAHFKRFENHLGVQETMGAFQERGDRGKWHGAKFALNPGVKAMEWIWLPMTFPEAKIIFIRRNLEATFNSYYKQDVESVRGVIPWSIYEPLTELILKRIEAYCFEKPDATCQVIYENLLENPDRELEKIWMLLGIQKITGLDEFIKEPEFKGKK